MGNWTAPKDKPLEGVKRCKKTDCSKNLHCFLKDRKRRTPEGTCLACGIDLVDWRRVHRRDIGDIEHTLSALKHEHIRHEFWCTVDLTPRAINFALRNGRRGVLEKARQRIRKKLQQPGPYANWGQTPFEDKGNAVHFAQHATATCCRRCIEVWYGIPKSQVIEEHDVEYFARLILRYVVDRVPGLSEEGIYVPRALQPRTRGQAREAS